MNKLGYGVIYIIALATISNCIAWEESDFYGTYNMNHDGWRGTLYLQHNPECDTGYCSNNLIGTYTGSDGKVVEAQGTYKTDNNDIQEPGLKGGTNLLRLEINFGDPTERDGWQEFYGYLYSNNMAMAGITWWHTRPFGFYAMKISP